MFRKLMKEGNPTMTKTIKLDIEETLARLDSWLSKVEECYREEVRQSMESFKNEYELKK